MSKVQQIQQAADQALRFETLAARYGAAFAQQIMDQLEQPQMATVDAFDVMALNEMVHEMRQEIRQLLSQYRAVRLDMEGTGAAVSRRVYAGHRALFLARQISDVWRLYRMAHSDRTELYGAYIRQLAGVSPASAPLRRAA